jgi:hypothetical protein
MGHYKAAALPPFEGVRVIANSFIRRHRWLPVHLPGLPDFALTMPTIWCFMAVVAMDSAASMACYSDLP